MDRNAAYANVLRTHCPQAASAYDLFHVVAKYGREVIDRPGVDEANRLRRDKRARKTDETARAARKAWRDQALASGIAPLVRFARNLLPELDGVLASAARPLDTRLLEGINKEIKGIKRTAYDFRDAPCSALRIGAAFPGAPR